MGFLLHFTEITESGDVSIRLNSSLDVSIRLNSPLEVDRMTLIEDRVYEFGGFCMDKIIEENGTGLGLVLGTDVSKWADLFVTFVEKKDPFSYKLLQVPTNIDIIRVAQEICSEPVEDIQFLKDIMEFV